MMIGSNSKKPLAERTVYGITHYEIAHERKRKEEALAESRLRTRLWKIESKMIRMGYCI